MFEAIFMAIVRFPYSIYEIPATKVCVTLALTFRMDEIEYKYTNLKVIHEF